jgi:hypothetical protein
MKWLYASLAVLASGLGSLACDDDKGDSGDDNSDMTSSAEEEGSAEEGVEGCIDGEETLAVGDMRACMCTDGSSSSQTCLATGEFGICECAGW